MNTRFNEDSGRFEIIDLTLEQFTHILNCIMFVQDNDGHMPKNKQD